MTLSTMFAAPPVLVCAHCGKVAVSQCVRCKAAFYCCRKCQKFHWSRGKHKQYCVAAEERATFKDLEVLWVLFDAAFRGDAGLVHRMVQQGADNLTLIVNSRTAEDGYTPLYVCCNFGHDAIAHYLLEAGADKDLVNIDGFTPLHIAALKGHVAVVRVLLDAGANKNVRRICRSCEVGSGVRARTVVVRGVPDIDAGTTPLFNAAQEGHDVIVNMFLSAGANKDLSRIDGATPLQIATIRGHETVVLTLLKHERLTRSRHGAGKDIVNGIVNSYGATLLHIAVANVHGKVVRALLDAGADKDIRERNGATPLYIASSKGDDAIVHMLLDAGADKDLTDYAGYTPLHVAVMLGDVKVVRTLLDAGVKKDSAGIGGATPLHFAAGNEATNEDFFACPFLGGARIADKNGFDQVARTLLDAGADKDQEDKEGCTPLRSGAITRMLLDAGADKDLAGDDGCTPLMASALMGHGAITRMLLDAGADKDLVDVGGNTALHFAAMYGHDAVVRALLDANADKEAINSRGLSPFMLAAENGRTEVARTLEGAGTFTLAWERALAELARARVHVPAGPSPFPCRATRRRRRQKRQAQLDFEVVSMRAEGSNS